MLVENGCGGAKEKGVAGEEMLTAVNGKRPLLNDAGPDPVSPFEFFAPDRTGPKSPPVESLIVCAPAAAIAHNARAIGQQNRTPYASKSQKQPIEAILRNFYQPSKVLAPSRNLRLGQTV